jgi:O-antigen ligase
MLRKQKPFQLMSAAVLVVGLPVFILTLSRAAYLAAAGMFLLIVILLFRQFFKPSRIILLILLAIVTFVALTYAISLTDDQETTVSTFTRQAQNLFVGASYADRVSTSQAAIDLFKQHPLGIGPGNFGPSIVAHPLVEPKGGWLIVNNIYLEVVAEEGIIGLVGFLAFLAYVLTQVGATALKSADHFQKTVALSAFVAIAAICVQYLTFSILYIMHIWFALGIALAISSPWYKKT